MVVASFISITGIEEQKRTRGDKPYFEKLENCTSAGLPRIVDNNSHSADECKYVKDRLNCFYTNANSLINKISELSHRAQGMDIIAVTETWATTDIMDGEINIEGYTMFRKNRLHAKGWGVILYNIDEFTTMAYETTYTTEFSESVWCKIMLKNQELIVGVCYRSPASSEDKQ